MSLKMAKMKMHGYVTVRPFGNMTIPVPVQNLLLRNYVEQKGGNFVLPLNEHKFNNCFMQLYSTLDTVEQDGHVVLSSSNMLPENVGMRSELGSIALKKSISLHFVLENKVVSSEAGYNDLNESMKLLRFVDQANTSSVEFETDLKKALKFRADYYG